MKNAGIIIYMIRGITFNCIGDFGGDERLEVDWGCMRGQPPVAFSDTPLRRGAF